MRTKLFTLAAAAVLLFNMGAVTFADTPGSKAKNARSARLVAMLPASDGIAVFDAKRFFDDALPKVLSANQPMLSEVMTKIASMETRTGIDLRKFEQIAVGVAMKQVTPTEIDFEPVVIASGNMSSSAMIPVAKLASSGTYREEKIGTRTVYVISPKEVIQKTVIATSNSKLATMIDKGLKGLSNEIAVTELDSNTIVLGTIGRVRETIEGTARISPVLSGLLTGKEMAVMSFAIIPVGGMSKMLPLDNDALGANIDSIQHVSGSLDVAAAGASLQIAARTKKATQATELKDTVEGLQLIGKIFLGGSKRADQQVYGRMLSNAKLNVRGSDVVMDLLVPQSDIDILLASK